MISIVIPTKNNGDIIERCLLSIREQNYLADDIEIIVIDGHSQDNTVDIAKKYGCTIRYEEHGTISYARNLGIKEARGHIIAFTDADCVADPEWIKEAVKLLSNPTVAAVGGPNVTPDNDSAFARNVGAVLSFLSRAGARYGYEGQEVKEIYHNPTCNVFYQKKVLFEVGGFNHNLVTVDDEELDYRIRKQGYKILYTPFSKVYHYRRPSWKKFVKMAYNYGLGRMQAIKLHPDMGKGFHYIPSIVIIGTIGLYLASLTNIISIWVPTSAITLGISVLLLVSFYLSRRSKNGKADTIFGLIVIWIVFWGIGFIRGIFK